MNSLVLIVDDNPINLKLAASVLKADDFRVDEAGNADQALASIQRAKPVLILMDIAMPGMDGLALTRKLKGDPQTKDIVIVALTAFAMKGDEQKAYAAGCDGYIAKPIDTRQFSQQVKGFLENEHPRD
ncbi:MAG: response regulator [Chloroflexi bacterium]|nr:response regulator [Chloroflexota bacterium]